MHSDSDNDKAPSKSDNPISEGKNNSKVSKGAKIRKRYNQPSQNQMIKK